MKFIGDVFKKFNTNKYNGIYIEKNIYSIISEYNKKGFNPTFGKSLKTIPKIKIYFDENIFDKKSINIELLKDIKQYLIKVNSLYDGLFLDIYIGKDDSFSKLKYTKDEFESMISSNWENFISYMCINEPLTNAFLSNSNIYLEDRKKYYQVEYT